MEQFLRGYGHVGWLEMLRRNSVAVVLVLVVVGLLWGCSASSVVTESPPAGYVLQTKNIATGTIVVPAWGSRDLIFNIDGLSMANVRITGWFHASGGTDNEIETFIADDSSYQTWNQGRSIKPSYNSGKTTLADINVSMPSSTKRYHLVFNNVFSGAIKNIEAQIDLEYYVKPSANPEP